jgi:hypothetical protein
MTISMLFIGTVSAGAASYTLMLNDHSGKGTSVATFSSNGNVYTATYDIATAGTYYFYVSDGSSDYLNASQTFEDGTDVTLYKYGTSNYGHSITLNAERTGTYTFVWTYTTGANSGTINCTYPEEVTLGTIEVSDYVPSTTWIHSDDVAKITTTMKKNPTGNATYYQPVINVYNSKDKLVKTYEGEKESKINTAKKYSFAKTIDITGSDLSAGTYTLEAVINGYGADGETLVSTGSLKDLTRRLTVSEDDYKVDLTSRLTVNTTAEGGQLDVAPLQELTLIAKCSNGNKSAGEYEANTADRYDYDFYYYTSKSSTAVKIGDTISDTALGTDPVTTAQTTFTIPEKSTNNLKYYFYVTITAYKNDVAISLPCSSVLKGLVTANVVTDAPAYKATAYTDVNDTWVDCDPDNNTESTATLVKWSNFYGSNQSTATYNNKTLYTFYLPATVDMNKVTLYTNLYSLKIGDTTITSGKSYSFTKNKYYTLTRQKTASDAEESKYVIFRQGSSSSAQLYLNTTTELPSSTNSSVYNASSASSYKDTVSYKGGQAVAVENGNLTTTAISKIKGRGNSSWEASCRLYGKYAFNVTLDSKIKLFSDLTKSKKFCLLASNVDEAQARNPYIYQLAEDLNLGSAPGYQMVDMYDNGVYMGSYLVTDKVEMGSSSLVQTSNTISNTGTALETATKTSYNGRTIGYDAGVVEPENYKTCDYLLEFELDERYQDEISYFVSGKGQPIVVNNPESASLNEVKFIKDQWDKVESAVYNGNLDSVRDMIDVESFAKVYLITELSKNLDGGATSYNVHYKGAEGKFYAEPVWDYDWALGGYSGTKSLYSSYANNSDADNCVKNYYGFFAKYKAIYYSGTNSAVSGSGAERDFECALCTKNSSFWADVQNIWQSEFYSKASADNSWLTSTYYSQISDTIAMNEARWGFISSNPSTSWGTVDMGSTFSSASSTLSSWISNRISWLNKNIPASTTYSATAKTNSDSANVTVSAVNYKSGSTLSGLASKTYVTFNADETVGDTVFKGWASTNSLSNIVSKSASYSTALTADTTLYAIYADEEETDATVVTDATETTATDTAIATLYYVPTQDSINSGYYFRANVQSSDSVWYQYIFTPTEETYNGVTVYKAEITDSFDKIATIQYQVYADADFTKWKSQIRFDALTSTETYNNKMLIASTSNLVEVKFDSATPVETTSATAEKSNYVVRGTFNSWSDSATPLYKDGNNASTTINLEAGTYTFKIYDTASSAWYGNSGTIVDTTETTSAVGWEMSTSANDCTLKATGGYYTFTFTANKYLIISYSAQSPTEATTVAPTTVAPTTEATETTEAPTTVVPTTEATETTVAPTTVAPTTIAPTTEVTEATTKATEPTTEATEETTKATEPTTEATEETTKATEPTTVATEATTQATEPTTEAPTEPETGVAIYYVPNKSLIETCDTFYASVKDSAGASHRYNFTATDETYNGQTIYKASIVNAKYTDVASVGLVAKSGSAFKSFKTLTNYSTLSDYNKTMYVISEGKLKDYTCDVPITLYYVPTKALVASCDTFYASVKDSNGVGHRYDFTATEDTYNGLTIYKTVIRTSSYTDVQSVGYVAKSGSTFKSFKTISPYTTTSDYDNTMYVLTDSKLIDYTCDVPVTLYYVPTKTLVDSCDTFYASVKDSKGTGYRYDFVATDDTYNGQTVYTTTIRTSKYTDVTSVAYVAKNGAVFKTVKTISTYSTISAYNNKMFVASDGKLVDYAYDTPVTLYYVPTKALADTCDTFYASVKDSNGVGHRYDFTATEETYNGQTVYSTTILTSSYTDIQSVGYVAKAGNTIKSFLTRTDFATLAEYNDTTYDVATKTLVK